MTSIGNDNHGGEPIQPAAVTITVGAPPQAASAAPARVLKFGLLALFLTLLLIAAWVVFVLPRQLTDGASSAAPEQPATVAGTAAPAIPQAAGPATAGATAGTPTAPAATPFADARLKEARQEAQAALEALLSARRALEERNVARWADDDYQAGLAAAATGDEAYQSLDYPRALAEYRGAQSTFETLLERADQVLADTLARGSAALEAGDAEQAAEAYALALAIDGDNEEAVTGATRARVNAEVHGLINAARQALDAGELDAARSELQRAAALDGELALTKTLSRETAERITERDFTAAMSRGYRALDGGDYAGATTAFKRALAVRPGAGGAREGLRQAQRAASARRIETLLGEAAGHSENERWQQALQAYDGVLAIDGDVAAAKSGRSNAAARLELERQMRIFLAAPERLASDAVHREALNVAARARQMNPAGPRHAALLRELSTLLETARTPVAVSLRSDGETLVEVYKVGAFGSFESHQLELVPGRYVAIGTKPGFRDVRVEFMVSTGRSANPIIVQCTEKI